MSKTSPEKTPNIPIMTSIYTYIYIYIYICIHTYTYVYIYTCISVFPGGLPPRRPPATQRAADPWTPAAWETPPPNTHLITAQHIRNCHICVWEFLVCSLHPKGPKWFQGVRGAEPLGSRGSRGRQTPQERPTYTYLLICFNETYCFIRPCI